MESRYGLFFTLPNAPMIHWALSFGRMRIRSHSHLYSWHSEGDTSSALVDLCPLSFHSCECIFSNLYLFEVPSQCHAICIAYIFSFPWHILAAESCLKSQEEMFFQPTHPAAISISVSCLDKQPWGELLAHSVVSSLKIYFLHVAFLVEVFHLDTVLWRNYWTARSDPYLWTGLYHMCDFW